MITAEQASRMSDHEASHLIFLPGFSTAEKVTNVSGRGVGMDVVKTNIEKIGGTVDLQSQAGEGTTLKIKIPLTLAIIPALIVTSGGDRFAIPQVSLLELVRLEGKKVRTGIEFIHGAPVYRLRGRLLPLVYLNLEMTGDGSSKAHQGSHARNAPGAKLINFDLAREAHRRWVKRLRDLLDGKTAMSVEEAGSHKICNLGKWLYSEGLSKYGDLPEFQALEKRHAVFHDLVKNIVMQKASGRLTEAEQQFANVSPISQDVVGLLTAVEQNVLKTEDVIIVVLQADGHPFGLVVDEINDTEEIVVKPLGKQLKGVASFAGATIMGDGRVALILDVLGLAQRANVVTELRDRTLAEKGGQAHKTDRRPADPAAVRRRPGQSDGHSPLHGGAPGGVSPVGHRACRRAGGCAVSRADPAAHPRLETCPRRLRDRERPERNRCRWWCTPNRDAVWALSWDASTTSWTKRSQ